MKNLKELKDIKTLSKNEQRSVNGGENICLTLICPERYHCELGVCVEDPEWWYE
jgi:hypothetical protein